MCHVSELADEFVKEASSVVQPGDRVRARVLRVDVEKGKVYLSLKPSNFDEEFLDPKAPTATKTTFADDEEEEGSDDGGSSEVSRRGERERRESKGRIWARVLRRNRVALGYALFWGTHCFVGTRAR
jgi:rRNA biogenesis protein RRP5